MTISRAGLCLLGVLICCACAPVMTLSAPPNAPPDVAAACQLANRRCSHCHSVNTMWHTLPM